MPGTKRTPVNRRQLMPITAEAIRLYWKMIRIRCTVAPYTDWKLRENCANCRAWWDLHALLDRELKNKPWEWPAICPPCMYNNDDDVLVRRQGTPRMWETARRIRKASHQMKASKPKPQSEPQPPTHDTSAA